MLLIKHCGLLIAALLAHLMFANKDNLAMEDSAQPERSTVEKMAQKQKIVFLITEDPDNYKAHETVPKFAEMLEEKYGYEVTVLLGSGGHGSYTYPQADVISRADLLVVFARRIALPHQQMKALKNYIESGKPVVGIRTANHAFTVNGKIEEGFEDWPEFVSDILGCENRGYGPVEPGTEVTVPPDAVSHPVLKDIATRQWHSNGNVYLVAPLLDQKATVLLTGKVSDIVQPIAWTRTAGESRVFYTSLGYPTDFETPVFVKLLINAIQWALHGETRPDD